MILITSFKPVICSRRVLAQWCALNGPQVCRASLGNGHLLIGPLGIWAPHKQPGMSKKKLTVCLDNFMAWRWKRLNITGFNWRAPWTLRFSMYNTTRPFFAFKINVQLCEHKGCSVSLQNCSLPDKEPMCSNKCRRDLIFNWTPEDCRSQEL